LLGLSGVSLAASAFAQGQPSTAASTVAALSAANNVSAAPAPAPVALNDDDNVIVATVNDEPITNHDVERRLSLQLSLNPSYRPTDEEKARMRRNVVKILENELLRKQAARNKSITVSPKEIDQRLEQVARANNSSLEEMMEGLKRNGANIEALRDQIQIEIAWQRAIEDELRTRRIEAVSAADIDAEIARIAERSTKPRYHVLQIFLAVDDPKDDAKVKKDAEDIVEQIKQGANFQTVAHQFGQDPSAASGGDIGWASDGQLAEELSAALRTMKKGQLSEPIRSRGGYYILLLAERMEPYGTKIPPSPTAAEAKVTELPLVRILLPLGEKPDKELMDRGLGIANQIRQSSPPCGAQLKKTIEDMHSIYMDLGLFKLADLSPELQAVLAKTRSGETAEPVVSQAGVEVMVRCDPQQEQLTAFEMPTRDEVENQLFGNRASAVARGFERDLKRNANIEEH
jgi:peptidyl-prolyl cis-trans isomerase SurA